MSKIKLSLHGFKRNDFRSLERTRKLYHKAICEKFEVAYEDTACDGRFFFSGSHFRANSDMVPRVLPIHGGAVISRNGLHQLLRHFRQCDRLIANCSADVVALREHLNDPDLIVSILPLAVNTHVFRPQSKECARGKLGIPASSFVLGYVGRIIPQKGLHRLLDLLVDLRRAYPSRDVRVVAVGDYIDGYPILPFTSAAAYRSYLSKLLDINGLSSHVTMYGGQQSEDVLNVIYNSFDVLVHLSHTVDENFGYVPIEAMAAGTPVVATDYGGLRDSIQHGMTGFLVPTWTTTGGLRSNFESAHQYVRELLLSRTLRESMSGEARATVQRKYSFEGFAERLYSIILSAIESRTDLKQVQRPLLRDVSVSMCHLPDSAPHWREISAATVAYGSEASAQLADDVVLVQASRLTSNGAGVYVAEDPCWPAEYHLTERQFSIYQECREGKVFKELCRIHPETDVRYLFESGVLTMGATGTAAWKKTSLSS